MRRSADNRRAPVQAPRTILGIDPGTLVTGYGVVAGAGPSLRLLAAGTIANGRETPLPARLGSIYNGLLEVIRAHRPDEIALETAFYGKNAQSALKLGHARGVCMLAAVLHGIPLAEYAPREIKKAVVGNGNASKEQVAFMVRTLLGIKQMSMLHDTTDAIATALCHLGRQRQTTARHADWKSFIAAHPERVRP